MQHLIALCGPAGVGKSTLAKLLSKRPYNYIRLGFALPIKTMIGSLLELQGVKDNNQLYEMLYGTQKEIPSFLLSGQTPRRAMQTLGTEWGRDLIHPDLWIEIWRRLVIKIRKVVVDDLRFENELKAIRELDGVVVKIERDNLEHSDGSVLEHISEKLQSHIEPDFTIVNDGEPIDMLHELQHFLGRRL